MCSVRRQRDRVRERADHQPGRGAILSLNGNDAFIEDSTALGSNSALTGLASIVADAALDLENGASVSTTGALANDGFVAIDIVGGDGGSSLNIGGTLTNSDTALWNRQRHPLGVGQGDGGGAR